MDFVRASNGFHGTLLRDSAPETILLALPEQLRHAISGRSNGVPFRIGQARGFLTVRQIDSISVLDLPPDAITDLFDTDALSPAQPMLPAIQGLAHVRGLRGNPERAYPRSEIGEDLPGAFEPYVASLIHHWAETEGDRFTGLIQDLRHLGIARYLKAQRIDDTRVELQVARLPAGERFGNTDLVNIADVGFGVSQALPVLAALRAAAQGQLVYIEQPELHLHPSAQSLMADILVGAALQGIRVVVETHSDLLLRGIQTAIAKGRIAPANVSLNWFTRDRKNGLTRVTKADLDGDGAFGTWPSDFDDVALRAEREYLDAVEARHGS
jgi:hypothetical protein